MKRSTLLAFLLALSLTACSTLEVGLEMTPTPGSPSINQSTPTTEPTKENRRPVDPAPTSVSPVTASTRTTLPPSTLVPGTLVPAQRSQPLPPATPILKATIKSSPSESLPATSSSDLHSPYQLPTPAFFFKSGEGKIYYLDGRERHGVDGETFLNLGYQENDIVNGNSMEMSYPEGAPLTRLVKGSGEEVYWLEGGYRRHIPDMDTFRQLGYRAADVFQVSDNLLRTWSLGESLPSALGTPAEPAPTASPERVVLSYRPLDRHARASELYTVFADGRNPRRLSYTTGYTYHTDATWSPDGRSIAFVQCLSDMPNSTGCEIFVTSPDRWEPRRLAQAALLHGPTWSPDGNRLAFTQGSMGSSIAVMNIDEGSIQPTTAESWKFAWTPDGRLAFWTLEREDPEKSQLMLMDADGQNVQPVETQVTVFDQRYSPWRQCKWVAGEPPRQ